MNDETEYLWWCPNTRDFLELVVYEDLNAGHSNEYDRKGRFVASVERIWDVQSWLEWAADREQKGEMVRCEVEVLAETGQRLVTVNGKMITFS